jgi:O-antigen ligase
MVFRGDARTARRLHPLEKALLIVTAIHLCFLPWAFGGMTRNPWPEWVSLGMAAVGFALALTNRHYTEENAREGEFDLVMWPKLVRFPLFWLGLLLLAYMAVQSLNPAWEYSGTALNWSMVPIGHITWLPAGQRAPFGEMNGWRLMLIYAAPWLTVCSLWVGITRRVTLLALLTTLAANGAVLALLGVVERVTSNGKILWLVTSPNRFYISSFVYKNHAGAYFNLVLAVSCSLLYWHFSRTGRRSERANPAPIFAFCAMLDGLIVLLSYARMATILLMVFVLVAAVAGLVWQARAEAGSRNPVAMLLLGAVLLLFGAGGLLFLDSGKLVAKMELLGSGDYIQSVEGRELATKATWEMAKDNLLTGWGAGSFWHYFPMYQQRYPVIYNLPNGKGHWSWEYAHDDFVQILAELGLVGAAIFVAGAAYWVFKLLQYGIFARPHALLIVFGLLLQLVNSASDLLLYCPAILVTSCVLWTLTARWVEFEDNRSGKD